MSKELTFNQKIIAIQNELKAPKNQYSEYGDYNYRSAEDILEAVKPLLKKYDLLQTIEDDIIAVSDRVYVKATVRVHTDNGIHLSTSAFAREMMQKKKMDDAQVTGSASSYARKYALNGMWLIDDGKDSDVSESGKPILEPDTDRWEKGIKALSEGKVDADTVKERYEISDQHLELFISQSLQVQQEATE